MVLAIFLVSLLAVSAASAEDIDASDIVGVNDLTDVNDVALQESPSKNVELGNSSDEVISSAQNDVVGADAGTFSDLKTKIDAASEGSTITLENDYVYEGSNINPITISKQLTIDGKGHAIDGN